jgi:hypothetical protein
VAVRRFEFERGFGEFTDLDGTWAEEWRDHGRLVSRTLYPLNG